MAPKAYIFSQKPLTRRSPPALDLVPSNAEAVVTSHRSPHRIAAPPTIVGCRVVGSCCAALLGPVEIIVDRCDIGR